MKLRCGSSLLRLVSPLRRPLSRRRCWSWVLATSSGAARLAVWFGRHSPQPARRKPPCLPSTKPRPTLFCRASVHCAEARLPTASGFSRLLSSFCRPRSSRTPAGASLCSGSAPAALLTPWINAAMARRTSPVIGSTDKTISLNYPVAQAALPPLSQEVLCVGNEDSEDCPTSPLFI